MLSYRDAIARHSKGLAVIPEREDMITFALHIERIGEEQGWDQPPALGVAADAGDGFASYPLPVQPAAIAVNGDVVGALLRIAETVLKSKHKLPRRSADATAAVWFLSEGWMHRNPKQWNGGRISELPGDQRSEVRTCILLDCAGRTYFVNRIKGESPELQVADPGDIRHTSGRVVDGLRRILLAVSKGMSPGMIDMEKVGQVGA